MRSCLLAVLIIAACSPASGQAGSRANGAQPAKASASPSGTTEEQVAQLLIAVIGIEASRDWSASRAAFAGARWRERVSDTTPTVVHDGITYPGMLETRGYTDALEGSIAVNGGPFRIELLGTPERVTAIRLNAPEGTIISRPALRRAIAARGANWRLARCDSLGDGRNQTIVELSSGGRSVVFEDSFSGQASAYTISFDGGLYDPADPPGDCAEAELRDLR